MTLKDKLLSFTSVRVIFYFLVGFYVFSAQVLVPLNDWQEVFPFFHWGLYSDSAAEADIYQLKIESLGKENQSCLIQDCSFFTANLRNIEFYNLLQTLGRSIRHEDTSSDNFNKNKYALEERLWHENLKPFKYSILRSHINIIDYAKARITMADKVVYESEVRK